MKQVVLAALIAVTAALATNENPHEADGGKAHGTDWNYIKHGDDWNDVSATCGGKMQSPIDLITKG